MPKQAVDVRLLIQKHIVCVQAGAHSFGTDGICTVCTAVKDGPRLFDSLLDRQLTALKAAAEKRQDS